MWKRLGICSVIVLLVASLSGCSWFWGQPQYQTVLKVEGLSACSATRAIAWQAQSSGQDGQVGIADVTDATWQVPLKIAPGLWQFSLQLHDANGLQLFSATQESLIDQSGQQIVFTVECSNDEEGKPDEEQDPPLEEPDPPVKEPELTWAAWNGTLQPTPTGLLQGPNNYQTPYYIIDSGIPGPVLLINGGMHGNEPAGSLAAWRFVHYTPIKGKLVIIPELNSLGLKANNRTGSYPGDPNRDYPRSANETADDKLSRNIWQLGQDQQVTWLIDLHEGYDYHKVNSSSVGQSIIMHKGTAAQHATRDQVVNAMITAANKTVSNANHRFSHLHNPVVGSLARATGDYLGVAAMIIETSRKQSLSLRIEQHEIMVSTAMRELGML
jgi:hypothetical protein